MQIKSAAADLLHARLPALLGVAGNDRDYSRESAKYLKEHASEKWVGVAAYFMVTEAVLEGGTSNLMFLKRLEETEEGKVTI